MVEVDGRRVSVDHPSEDFELLVQSYPFTQSAAALREAGFDARSMAGGHYAWKAIKGPVKFF